MSVIVSIICIVAAGTFVAPKAVIIIIIAIIIARRRQHKKNVCYKILMFYKLSFIFIFIFSCIVVFIVHCFQCIHLLQLTRRPVPLQIEQTHRPVPRHLGHLLVLIQSDSCIIELSFEKSEEILLTACLIEFIFATF